MIWQDAAFAAGSLAFLPSLVVMIRAKRPPPLYSSLSTGVILAGFVGCYASLGTFWLATATTAVSSALWFALALQAVFKLPAGLDG